MNPTRCSTCGALYDGTPAACHCGSTTFEEAGLQAAGARAWDLVAPQLRGEILCVVQLAAPPSRWGLPWKGATRAILKLGEIGDWAVYCSEAAALPEDEESAVARIAERGLKLHREEACGLFPFANPDAYRR